MQPRLNTEMPAHRMRYFFAYRFYVPENHFGNIIIMVGWHRPPSGGPLSVAVVASCVSPPPNMQHQVEVSLITEEYQTMNKLLTWLVANAPKRHQIPVRLFQIRYQRAIRVTRALLLPPALTREA